MRIAVLSDIHGNLPALQAVQADMARRGVDQVINCGDILSGPLWPRETGDELMALGWPTIAGNHERQLLACARRPGGASDQYRVRAQHERRAARLARRLARHAGADAWRFRVPRPARRRPGVPAGNRRPRRLAPRHRC